MKLTAKQVAADLELERQATAAPWEYKYLEECLIKPHVIHRTPSGGSYTIATPVHSNVLTAVNMQLAARARTALPDYAEALQEAMLRLQSCHEELKCEQRNCPTRAVIDDFFEPEGSGEGKK